MTPHSRHVCILSYGGRHFEGQKCIAVIERNVVIVLLFANASDYSDKTCIFCKIQAHITVYASLVEQNTEHRTV